MFKSLKHILISPDPPLGDVERCARRLAGVAGGGEWAKRVGARVSRDVHEVRTDAARNARPPFFHRHRHVSEFDGFRGPIPVLRVF